MKTFLSTLFILLCVSSLTNAQSTTIPLYPEGIKNHQDSDEKESFTNEGVLWLMNIQTPELEIFIPPRSSANQRAVVIFPGGGYMGLAYDWEGTEMAKWFNSKGYAAFVVKYRMPNSRSVIVGNEAPLQDAQRAIRKVRANAEEYNIDPDQVGAIGFSAGGHLASTLGTKYDFNDERFYDPNSIDSVRARPDYLMLIYPVITMKDEYTHMGSRTSLIGENPSKEMIDLYSGELHVDENTPPTFLIHSTDDTVVPVKNSLLFYDALQENGVYSEMHIYPYGGHGFSFAVQKGGHLRGWVDRMSDWLESLDLEN